MKADAFLPTAPLELDVPAWVPASVAQYARAKYAAVAGGPWVHIKVKFEAENDDRAQQVRTACADLVRDDLANKAERYRSLVCDHCMRSAGVRP